MRPPSRIFNMWKYFWLMGSVGSRHITVLHFVKTGHPVAEILWLLDFSSWRLLQSWILEVRILLALGVRRSRKHRRAKFSKNRSVHWTDIAIFQDGSYHYFLFLNLRNFIHWWGPEVRGPSTCQISSKSVTALQRYWDISFSSRWQPLTLDCWCQPIKLHSGPDVQNQGKVRKRIAVCATSTAPLLELTCYVGSHSVTCHPAEVTFPPLPQPFKAGTRFSDSRWMQGWVDLVGLVTSTKIGPHSTQMVENAIMNMCRLSVATGCPGEGDSQWRIFQSVEGLYAILCAPWAAHRADIHFPWADECSVLQVRARGREH